MKFEEKMRRIGLLPTQDCEAGHGPVYTDTQSEKNSYKHDLNFDGEK